MLKAFYAWYNRVMEIHTMWNYPHILKYQIYFDRLIGHNIGETFVFEGC